MTLPPTPPRLASRQDAASVTRTLGEAFAADPMVWWPLRRRPELQASLAMFGIWVPELTSIGTLWVVEDGLGVASWIGPDQAAAFAAADDRVAKAIATISDDGGERYRRFWGWAAGHVPSEPHWFLDMYAVRPGEQGRGLGAVLMRHGLQRADSEGLPAFLETSQQRNVTFYESFGFAVVDWQTAPGGGPDIWFMRREPQNWSPESA